MKFYAKYHNIYKCGELDDVCIIAWESKKQIRNIDKRYVRMVKELYPETYSYILDGNDSHKEKLMTVDWEWCEANRPQIFVAKPRIPTGWYNWEDYKKLVVGG